MASLTMLAFELADKYRNPAVLLADGFVGQMMEALDLELIETVAQHASAAVTAARLADEVQHLVQSAADLDEVAPRWDELHPL